MSGVNIARITVAMRVLAVNVAGKAINTQAMPANNSPIVNLPGLDGCRSPRDCQTAPIMGAKIITKIAGTDWNQLEGYCQPNNVVRVIRSAKSVKLEPA